jgi:hypothetical protein
MLCRFDEIFMVIHQGLKFLFNGICEFGHEPTVGLQNVAEETPQLHLSCPPGGGGEPHEDVRCPLGGQDFRVEISEFKCIIL